MAKHKGDPEIGHRMWEEIFRLFNTQEEAASKMDICRTLIVTWSKGGSPNAYALKQLALCGGDVGYVLTGNRRAESEELKFTRQFIHEHGLEFALASAWNRRAEDESKI